MLLQYLLFDASDEDDGAASFDAMASVLPQRLPALLQEIEAVLGWAHRSFGAPGEHGEWDYDLQATTEPHTPLAIAFDARTQRVTCTTPAGGRVTLTLTLSGSRTFADAFRDAFPDGD